LGASIIEKHISLDFNIPNAQDWKVSCGPHDLGTFIEQVRQVEAAQGVRDEGPTDDEKENLIWAGKSLVAQYDISAGSLITKRDLVSKRPGTGISPSQIENVIGRRVKIDLQADEVIKWESLD